MWLVGVSVVVVAFALASCRQARSDSTNIPPEGQEWLGPEAARAARIVEVQPRFLEQTINVGGKVVFNDLRVSHAFTPVSGRVLRVLAQPGQRVRKGTPLAVIISPDVGSAFSDLLKAKADLDAGEKDYVREQQLLAVHATSQRDMEAAEDNYHKVRAEYERAHKKAAMLRAETVRHVSQEYTLRSFIDGEVIARSVNPGIEVQGLYSAGSATELFTIGDIHEVWVYADVPEADLPAIQRGGAAEIRVVAYPGRSFQGTVDWIGATLDPTTRTGRIRCTLPNPNGELLPEMYASVAMAIPPRSALTVARNAIASISTQNFAFVAGGRRPDGGIVGLRRRVRVAETVVPDVLEVLGGLQPGERLVVEDAIAHPALAEQIWLSRTQLESAAVKLAQARVIDTDDAITIGGRLAFDDLNVTHVYAPITGRVTDVRANPGERVHKGAALLTMLSPDLATAYSDLAKAEADLAAAGNELRRHQELYQASAGSLRELESAEDDYQKAKAEHDRAEQKTQLLGAGKVNSITQKFTLRSPIAGEIIARNVNPGMEVQGQYSGAGQPVELFTIGQIDRLNVLGDLYEIDLPHVRQGDAVTIRVPAYPDRVFRGTVEWISSVLDPQLHTAKVRCIVANPDHLLKPEMYEMVTVTVPMKQRLMVPRQAVLRYGDQTVVFVQAGAEPDGRVGFRRRSVQVNEERPNGLMPVSEGLKPGETVASDGAVFLLGML